MNVTMLITGSEKFEEAHQLAVANVTHIPNVAKDGLNSAHLAKLLEQLQEDLENLDLGPDSLHRLGLHFFVDGVPVLEQSWQAERMSDVASAPSVTYKDSQLWLTFTNEVELKELSL